MNYSSLLNQLEKQLKHLQRRGKHYLTTPALQEAETTALRAGLKGIVPSPERMALTAQPKMNPSDLIRQNMGQTRQEVRPSGKPKKEHPSLTPAPMKSVQSSDGSIEKLRETYKDCMNCPLGETRTKLVFGSGSSGTPVMFIGEGPGADEDAQGEPFVGRAGKLLTKMIHSIGIDRSDVYITNVVKCRPPGNRNPEPLEVAACMGILESQLRLISPRLIVTLGNVPTRALIPDVQGITKARGNLLQYREWKLMPTFHPSYLLRNRTAMPLAWKDFRSIASLAFDPS